MSLIVVTDDTDRDGLAEAIGHLMAKYRRMPAHWEARRAETMREIERLVDRINLLPR
jgi:hypothetical protein